jgi:hypothetical protein
VTSSNPDICAVAEPLPTLFQLKTKGRGSCKITVHDTATGEKGEFSVIGI